MGRREKFSIFLFSPFTNPGKGVFPPSERFGMTHGKGTLLLCLCPLSAYFREQCCLLAICGHFVFVTEEVFFVVGEDIAFLKAGGRIFEIVVACVGETKDPGLWQDIFCIVYPVGTGLAIFCAEPFNGGGTKG